MRRPLVIYQILEKNEFNTGSVHQMFQAAVGLRRRGHRVTIISRPGEVLAARAEEEGIAYESLPLRNELDLRSIFALQRLIRRDGVDVIHVHKGLGHTLALAATLRRPVGCFVVNRGVSFPLTFWNRAKYRTARVDRIVTVCEDIRQEVVRSGHVPPEKVSVVYAGVDLARFDPACWTRGEFRRERGLDDDRFIVLQVGVREWKGWRELIDAFVDVSRAIPRAHLMLVGCRNRAEEEKVMAYAAARDVVDRVSAVEYRTDMARVLSAADCVVDASWAGTGITGTIREAMALGKPVVATDCGGNRELVSSRSVGWLVPPRDVVAITAAILAISANPDQAQQVGANAMAHVRSMFSMERRIDVLEELYSSVLDARED